MKAKTSAVRSIVIVLILILSILAGLLFQTIANAVDKRRYPQGYSEFVEKYSAECGVPEYVVYSVIHTESHFVSNAVSSSGAVGLMQIMPETFSWLMSMKKETLQPGMLYDPETNIRYGTYLLSYLYSHFNAWETAFAAYNAGMNRVDEWLADSGYSKDGKHLDNIPISETSNYVKKVKSAVEVYKRLYYNE